MRFVSALVVMLLVSAVVVMLLVGPHARADEGDRFAHPFFRGLPTPLVIAHRGGASSWPENTLIAFRAATALGADVLELDLHVSADGILVVIHDATVDRTTDGTGRVDERTITELRALDAAYRWSPDGGVTYPYRGRGVRIPTFDDVLAALPDVRLSAEIKEPAAKLATEVCRSITRATARDRVMVASFESDAIEEFRSVCPAVATGATPREAVRFLQTTALPFVASACVPAVALQLPERHRGIPVLRRAVVAAAHAQGVQVHAWTINEETDMRRLLDMGVDGIVTDRPGRLLAVLGRRPAPSLPP